MYSVQQLTFECLSYIKEFQPNPRLWLAGAVGAERDRVLRAIGLDNPQTVWLFKPALSIRAAQAVAAKLVTRYQVRSINPDGQIEPGAFVLLATQAASMHRSLQMSYDFR